MYLLFISNLYMNNRLKSYILSFIIYAYSIICPRQIGFANIVQYGILTQNNSLHLRHVNLPSAPGRRGRGSVHNILKIYIHIYIYIYHKCFKTSLFVILYHKCRNMAIQNENAMSARYSNIKSYEVTLQLLFCASYWLRRP